MYYEPVVGNRYPDFVVIIPDCGLLVIEVKGWIAHQILGGDSHAIRLRARGAEPETTAVNPIRQARDYMYGLMDSCKRHPAGLSLLQPDGPHKGKFAFPFGFCAVLTQISDEELTRHPSGNLRSILPADHVVDGDEADAWGSFTGVQLRVRLASFFHPKWEFPRLIDSQVTALRAILHPEVLVPPTPAELASVATVAEQLLLIAQDAGMARAELRALDAEQERSARSLGSGHRLLFGVAGSGKTVVLVARAKFLSEALPSGRILVLCFNVSFRTYLRTLLGRCPNVDVFTFHGWGSHNEVTRQDGEAPALYGERLLRVLEAGHGDAGRYDAVLIDEAQDFDPKWFTCAKAAMKEPMTGDLLIVGDRNQTSYLRESVSWRTLHINAVGRTKILRRNYRNTREILVAAAPFADDAEAEDGIAAAAWNPQEAARETGTPPMLIACHNRASEIAEAEALVQKLLHGRFSQQRIPALQPGEIGILYRKKDDCLDHLVARLERLAPVVWLKKSMQGPDARQKVLEPGIKIQTIHSAKGLEYRAVILLFADQIGAAVGDEESDRRLLYVALTRAQEILAVTYSAHPGVPQSRLLDAMFASGAFGTRALKPVAPCGPLEINAETDPLEAKMKSGTFRFVRFDEDGVAGKPDNLRLVCITDTKQKVAIWGQAGERSNIDAVLGAGLPCTVETEWRDPSPFYAERFGHTHWVRQDFRLVVTG